MRVKHLVVALRLPILVAIAASTALLIEYWNVGTSAFCSAGSGCSKVRASAFSKFLGVPLPIIGLAAFGVLFALGVVAKTKLHHRAVAAMAGLGGLLGAALIVAQAVAVHAFCKWCLAVDVSAIIAGGLALAVAFAVEKDEQLEEVAALGGSLAVTAAWSLAGALTIGLPFVWSRFPTVPPLPAELEPLTVAGKINVISFTDFQCPFCRQLHPMLDELREQHGAEIHFVRKMVPLAGHAHAMPAALAWECVPEAARDRMAASLYETPASKLEEDAPTLAANLGADKDAYAKCVADPVTRARVEADIALFRKIEGQGLPLTYVDKRAVGGANEKGLDLAWRAAHEGGRFELPVPAMWIVLALAYAGAAALTLRNAGNEPAA